MRIKYSLFSRRRFINGLIGGGAGVLAASFLSPILKFVFPPYREPDEVILPISEYKDMTPGSVKGFAWGNKPGILKMKQDGTHLAFVAVCTHLDCNVVYLQDKKKFYCACHEGWYDEEGKNIAGPPPHPLRRLTVTPGGENLVIRTQGKE